MAEVGRCAGSETECLPGEYDIQINHNVATVIHPPEAVPVAVRQQLEESENIENSKVTVTWLF